MGKKEKMYLLAAYLLCRTRERKKRASFSRRPPCKNEYEKKNSSKSKRIYLVRLMAGHGQLAWPVTGAEGRRRPAWLRWGSGGHGKGPTLKFLKKIT